MRKKWPIIAIPSILFLVFCSVFYIQTIETKHKDEPFAKKVSCAFSNINPLRCEPDLNVKKKEYTVLRNELMDYISDKKAEGTLTEAGVYFRDLQNGPILNINEQDNFIPASLLKLPLMIMYYKKAESDPRLLSERIKVAGDLNTLEQNVTPSSSAHIGQTYSIDELLTLLITQSDNISWKVLLNYLRSRYSEEDFIATLSDLGIVDPRKRNDQQYITVQGYASLFRILYNSSYLDLEMSDKALDVLTQTAFKEGIVAGVPQDLKVAHKFGEQKNGEEQQFHDCGIVYYPSNPYIVCIMTRGDSPEELKPIIKEISHKVYEEVKYRNEHGEK